MRIRQGPGAFGHFSSGGWSRNTVGNQRRGNIWVQYGGTSECGDWIVIIDWVVHALSTTESLKINLIGDTQQSNLGKFFPLVNLPICAREATQTDLVTRCRGAVREQFGLNPQTWGLDLESWFSNYGAPNHRIIESTLLVTYRSQIR
jgi:hypothetical protein